jgi:hypothetical protein
MPFCPDCGYKMLSRDKYCYNCGKLVIDTFSSLIKKTNIKDIIPNTINFNEAQQPTTRSSTTASAIKEKHEENTSSKTESEILNLPYSWTANDIEITILGLERVEDYKRNNPLSNKKQYEVLIKFRNLLKTSNKIKGNLFGFDTLKLRTDVGNTWDLKSNVENLTLAGDIDPEEEFIRNDSVFEIREKELPEYLIAEIFGKKYLFAIKIMLNRRREEEKENYQSSRSY